MRRISRRIVLATTLGLLLVPGAARAADAPAQRADALLARMTLDEKLDLVCCGKPTTRLGIPSIAFTDGPNGLGAGQRGVTSFPNAVNIGASWDRSLARRYGEALGGEARGKAHTLIAAPTINIVRTPQWGRAPETFGEDPFLMGSLVAPEIRGIQSRHVIAQVKHFAGNNQEIGRFGNPLLSPAIDDVVSMRALQEIYFPAFKAAVQRGRAGSVMCSYNRINGVPSCQDPLTLGILKGWGLRGFVGPDATLAIRDLLAAANAGVDNFQLGSLLSAASGVAGAGGLPERAALKAALAVGTIPQARIDDATRRILIALIGVGVLDSPPGPAKDVVSTAADRALATSISARASVLLQNRRVRGRPVLPLTRADRSVAVIGYDAGKGTQTEEGGSPAVRPGRPVITPLAGIRRRAPRGTRVSYAPGTLGVVALPIVPASVLTPSSGSGPGLSGTFFAGTSLSGTPVATRTDPTLDFASMPAPLAPIPGTSANSARWTGTLTPPKTGQYRFSLTFSGRARLLIDGTQVAAGDTEFVNGAGSGFAGAPDSSYQGLAHLTAGRAVSITVEYSTNASIAGAELHLGWQPPDSGLLARAVAAARKAEVAVVFANDVSSEGMDRSSLSLPGDQDGLIEAVAKANPRTVVVLHTASAVLMPWRRHVAAIVEAWYPGQQSGAALAKTLFGDVDPSGRLPVTFPASESQGPATKPADYPGLNGQARYSDGINVGYRFYDRFGQRPLFPFGYGLSYTSFSLRHLNVGARGHDHYDVSVRLRNTGRHAGAQVVELYLGFPAAAGEPPRQLKGFARAFLRPGRGRTVHLALARTSFERFDTTRNAFAIVPGTYRLYVGSSSRDLPLERSLRVR